MTHAPAGDRLNLRDVRAEGTFEAAVLPTVRMARERAVEALVLEAMIE
ncbi:hypothetical protein [Protaetiibacter larvae]|nr:hypothetical protein [Protaetiibacter larvae]